ncbi:hypothetical protein Hanom_Chr04g00354761 [Helianthus anomalus]
MVYDDNKIINEAKYMTLNFIIKLLSRLMNIHYDILVAQIRRTIFVLDVNWIVVGILQVVSMN